jgi:CRP/FNR family transcriptional regulator, cyclic AMP receptor protein
MTTHSSPTTGEITTAPAGSPAYVLQALGPLKCCATYPEGFTLLLRDAPVDGVFLLLEGSVKVSISSDRSATIILGIATPGEVLGLSAAVSGTPSEITAETMVPSRLCFIRRDHFLRALNLDSESCLQVVQLISRQLRQAFGLIRILGGAQSARKKLAALLLNWAGSRGAETDQGIEIEQNLTEEEIGQMIGTSRGTVSRLLATWKREQVLSVDGSTLCIRKKTALQELAGSKRRRAAVRQTSEGKRSVRLQ